VIPELDIDQLDADLYEAWEELEKGNNLTAALLVGKSWLEVRKFTTSILDEKIREIATKVEGACELHGPPEQVERFRSIMEESGKQTEWARVIILPDLEGWEGVHKAGRLRATTDRDLRALLTKVWYAVLNRLERFPDVRQCHRDGLECEYIYPYGFVPEGGCPRHDP
jgi:hypothetical protein